MTPDVFTVFETVADFEKRFYADPAMSLVIGIMLILTAWKLSKFPFSSW